MHFAKLLKVTRFTIWSTIEYRYTSICFESAAIFDLIYTALNISPDTEQLCLLQLNNNPDICPVLLRQIRVIDIHARPQQLNDRRFAWRLGVASEELRWVGLLQTGRCRITPPAMFSTAPQALPSLSLLPSWPGRSAVCRCGADDSLLCGC